MRVKRRVRREESEEAERKRKRRSREEKVHERGMRREVKKGEEEEVE